MIELKRPDPTPSPEKPKDPRVPGEPKRPDPDPRPDPLPRPDDPDPREKPPRPRDPQPAGTRRAVRLLLAVVAAATFALPGRLAARPDADAGAKLVVLPSGVELLDTLRVNTQEKVVLADGSYNDRYVFRTPEPGDTFLHVSLQIAADRERTFHREDVVLRKGKEAARVPVDWFLDVGLAKVRGDALTIQGKGILEVTFEAPEEDLGDWVLYLGSVRAGSVKELREATGNGEETG